MLKKRALDYANKEIISEKNKNEYKSLSPEQKKRGDERILNSGLIDNHQKNKQN